MVLVGGALLAGCGAPEDESEGLGVAAEALTTDHFTVNFCHFTPKPGQCSGYGYVAPPNGCGSISPAHLTGHPNVSFDILSDRGSDCLGDPNSGYFFLWGFTADPGKAFVSSIQVGSGPIHYGSTATYSYGGGVATWIWTGHPFGYASDPDPVTVTLQHN
jgi:hypothetical protein